MNLSKKKSIFTVLISCWIIFAFFNILYNSAKTVSEIKVWTPLSDAQKRQKIFGDSYNFSVFINTHTTKHAKILFYSETSMPYFYARYYSYPRLLYWYQNPDDYVKSTYPKRFDYIALYNSHNFFGGYVMQATYSAKQSGISGSLYKRK